MIVLGLKIREMELVNSTAFNFNPYLNILYQ